MKIKAALKNPYFWPWMIVVPGVILRVWDITTSPLWYDEAFSRLVANLPDLGQVVLATAGDVHPPLYYSLLWFVVHIFGGSVLAVRLFSVVFGLAGLYLTWLIAGQVGLSHSAKTITLALMTFFPVEIYYSQETRMYTLLQFLVLAQVLYLLRRDWLKFACVTLLALYTHNYALYYTAILGLVGLALELRRSDKQVVKLVASIAIPGVAWLPWAFVLMWQMRAIQGNFWIPTLEVGSVLYAVFQILGGFNVFDPLIPLMVVSISAGLTLLFIQAVQRGRWYLVAIAAGPLALAVISSIAWQPVILFRGLIGLLPILAIMAGESLASTRWWPGRVVGLALLVPFVFTLVWQVGANHAGRVKGVLTYDLIETSEPIIHLDDTTMVVSQEPGHNYFLDAGCPAERGELTEESRQALGFQTVTLENLPNKYYFVGLLTPLSTQCHQDVVNSLAAGAVEIEHFKRPLGEFFYGYSERN